MDDIKITMHTNKGDIELTLFPDEAPVSCASFLNLAQGKFYDGLTFHRVIANFMIQGGDPTGSGSGGPGYKFECEHSALRRHDKAGILSMANAGPNTNGSQFFITHVPTPHLDGHHTVFGETSEGQEVVNAIRQGDTIESISIHSALKELFTAQATRLEEWSKHLD